jgi:hypothetical protein
MVIRYRAFLSLFFMLLFCSLEPYTVSCTGDSSQSYPPDDITFKGVIPRYFPVDYGTAENGMPFTINRNTIYLDQFLGRGTTLDWYCASRGCVPSEILEVYRKVLDPLTLQALVKPEAYPRGYHFDPECTKHTLLSYIQNSGGYNLYHYFEQREMSYLKALENCLGERFVHKHFDIHEMENGTFFPVLKEMESPPIEPGKLRHVTGKNYPLVTYTEWNGPQVFKERINFLSGALFCLVIMADIFGKPS